MRRYGHSLRLNALQTSLLLRAGHLLPITIVKLLFYYFTLIYLSISKEILSNEELDSEYVGHLAQSIDAKNASLRKYDGLAAASNALLGIGALLSCFEDAPYILFFRIQVKNELPEFGLARTDRLALACGFITALQMATATAAHVTVWQLASAYKRSLEDGHMKDSHPELDLDVMGNIRSMSRCATAILVLSAVGSALNLLFLLFVKVLPTRWKLPADEVESMPLANSQAGQNDVEDYENTGPLAEAYRKLHRESTVSRDTQPVATATNRELVVPQHSPTLPASE